MGRNLPIWLDFFCILYVLVLSQTKSYWKSTLNSYIVICSLFYPAELDKSNVEILYRISCVLFRLFFLNMKVLLYIVAIYFVLINIVTFLIRGIDKRKAEHQRWRIKEKTLLRLAAIGWFLGALMGINMFHHKTIKWKFLRRSMLIMFGWVVILAVFTYLRWIN